MCIRDSAYIEESGIPGLEVSSETKRYYPNKNTAAHIIGYMGSISESESKEYVEKGYSASDLIGKEMCIRDSSNCDAVKRTTVSILRMVFALGNCALDV